MKTFIYRDELYIRVIPTKTLFHSTTVHEVVNRGDIFAMRVKDQVLTIVPGKAEVQHSEHILALAWHKVKLMPAPAKPVQTCLGFIDS